jgi:hypothetical protein
MASTAAVIDASSVTSSDNTRAPSASSERMASTRRAPA